MFDYTSVVLVFIVHFRLSLLKFSTAANLGTAETLCTVCMCVFQTGSEYKLDDSVQWIRDGVDCI